MSWYFASGFVIWCFCFACFNFVCVTLGWWFASLFVVWLCFVYLCVFVFLVFALLFVVRCFFCCVDCGLLKTKCGFWVFDGFPCLM